MRLRMMENGLYLAHKPIGYSYRVEDRIYAGEYPVWDWDQGARMSQVRLFTNFGITDFLDLTEVGEMPPYEQFLPSGIRRHTFPVPDKGVPESVGVVADLFDRISAMMSERQDMNLYIHFYMYFLLATTSQNCCICGKRQHTHPCHRLSGCNQWIFRNFSVQ